MLRFGAAPALPILFAKCLSVCPRVFVGGSRDHVAPKSLDPLNHCFEPTTVFLDFRSSSSHFEEASPIICTENNWFWVNLKTPDFFLCQGHRWHSLHCTCFKVRSLLISLMWAMQPSRPSGLFARMFLGLIYSSCSEKFKQTNWRVFSCKKKGPEVLAKYISTNSSFFAVL